MIRRSAARHRRPLAVAGALTIAAGLLTGCSPAGQNGAGSSEPLTVTIWGSEIDRDVFEERLALAKEALPDVEVELVQISEDYDTKVQTMIAGGQAPDVLMMSEGINVLSSKGQLEDLTPYFDEAGIDPVATYGEGTVDTYSTDGSLWGAPDRSGAMVVFYNKDIFDAQGVDYPDGDWDWADFRSAAEALTKRSGDDVDHYGWAAGDWWPWYLTLMEQNGGGILDEDGEPIADSPENIEALEFYNDIVFEDGSAPSPVDYANAGLNNGQPDALFAQGKLAMVTTGFWNISSLNETDLDWDIAPLWHGAEAAVPAFGSALAVSSQSDRKDDAAALVQFLTSEEGQVPLVESGLDVPANLASLESDAFVNPSWNTAGVNVAAFSESASSIYSPPLTPEWNEIQKAFTDGLAGVWNGDEDVSSGLEKVQATLERILR